MLILTMGMIFVAMQFPVGLANSRKQTEDTLKLINTHNAKVMMELQIGSLVNAAQVIWPGSGANSLIVNDGEVHLLPKVNLLNDLTLVVDNPEGMLDLGASDDDYTRTGFYGGTAPDDFFPPYITIDESDNLKLGNLGQIMSPPVTSSDVEVVDIVGTAYNPNSDDPPNYPNMNQAIFDVALRRQYNWCALYKAIDANTIRFYIFTIRKSKNPFAMQYDAVTGEVFNLQNADEDRMYPVPWRIDLNNGGGIPTAAIDTRNFIGTGTKNAPQYDAPREFLLDEIFGDIFLEGTVFVDADPDLGFGWENNGYIYEVMENTRVSSASFLLRLQKPLEDDLNYLWVIPPAYDRSSGEFSDVNQVVGLAEQVIRF